VFVKAIEAAAGFTRAIQTISRNYGSNVIQPGTASLFFVNADGWALTCGHVARHVAAAEGLSQKRLAFKAELDAARGQKKAKALVRALEGKYGFSRKTPFEVYNTFVNCVEGQLHVEARVHPQLDVALLRFRNFSRIVCESFASFASDSAGLRPGKFLCRLGFPFPEFTNYAFDRDVDEIRWTQEGRQDTPWFPVEGMVTRHMADDSRSVIGFEMSTPGLRGQSGGLVFDADGVIWGMQASTRHLDLDFDVDQEVLRRGQKTRVNSPTFLHVGQCVHVDILKSFMEQHGVQFQEA